MKRIEHAQRIDLSEWNLGTIDDLQKMLGNHILKAAGEALQYAFESKEAYIYFPAEWDADHGLKGGDGLGGSEVDDPLTVYLRMPLCSSLEKPAFSFNLRESLQDSIDDCRIDGSFRAGLVRISGALRGLADEIDAAVAEFDAKGRT